MAFLKLLTVALAVVSVSAQGKLGGKGKGGKGKFAGKGGAGGAAPDAMAQEPAAGDAPAAAPPAGTNLCSREVLISTRDAFMKAVPKGPDLSGAKIAFNNVAKSSLAQTPYASIGSSTWTQLHVQSVDTDTCQIATFKVSSQQLLSTRLRLTPEGKITEVEFLQAVKGDQFFRPTGFPAKEPAMFNAKQVPAPPPQIPSVWTPAEGMFTHRAQLNQATCKAMSGAPRPWNRRELIYAANSYCDGLKGAPFDRCVFAGPSCPRNENGVTTTNNCGVGTGVFGFTVQGRRWVADTETGVVLGVFFFNYGGGQNLFLHEYFKVSKGGLLYIFAPMKNIPHAQAAANTFAQER